SPPHSRRGGPQASRRTRPISRRPPLRRAATALASHSSPRPSGRSLPFAGGWRTLSRKPADKPLQLARALLSGVFGENTPSRAAADPKPVRLLHLRDQRLDVFAVASRQDLFTRPEERFEPRPLVTDDGHPTCGCLEQPHARRIAGRRHVGAGDVEREPARAVELLVLGRRQMLDALDVGRPPNGLVVLRPGDHEPVPRTLLGYLDQQPLQLRLPIRTVGAEITQVPAGPHHQLGAVPLGIDTAVERCCPASPAFALQPLQYRAAAEREIDVEPGNELR